MYLISLLKKTKTYTRRVALTASSLLRLLLKERLYNPFKNIDTSSNKKSVRILANGPSLKEFLSQVDDGEVDVNEDDYCVVNDFVHDSHFEVLKPKYAVMSDPLFFIETIYSERGHRAMEAYAEKVKWPMNLFITYIYKDSKFLDPIKKNPNISIIILHNTYIRGEELGLNFIFRKGYGNGEFGTVALNALYAMIQFGYKIIYLYGIDHTFFDNLAVNDKNQLCFRDSHFYATDEELRPMLNHYSGVNKTHIFRVSEFLFEKAMIFKGHEIMNAYAKSIGVQVYNCCQNSMVDEYERLSNHK